MSDKAYRAFIQRQPSCLSGRFSEYVNGEGRCIAAHVRRASTSGTGFKAEYSCVPMTHREHLDQHQYGEAACLALHLTDTAVTRLFAGRTDDEAAAAAKLWFDGRVAKYRERWEATRK